MALALRIEWYSTCNVNSAPSDVIAPPPPVYSGADAPRSSRFTKINEDFPAACEVPGVRVGGYGRAGGELTAFHMEKK